MPQENQGQQINYKQKLESLKNRYTKELQQEEEEAQKL